MSMVEHSSKPLSIGSLIDSDKKQLLSRHSGGVEKHHFGVQATGISSTEQHQQ
jgi:hypothetical protein